MPYREPGRTPVASPSPDLDERLFQTQWWQSLLVLTGIFLPAFLLMSWLGNPTVHCGGSFHPETLAEKVAFSVTSALWVAALLYARARHRRRIRAAVAALEQPSGAASHRIRVEPHEQATPPAADEVEADGSVRREETIE